MICDMDSGALVVYQQRTCYCYLGCYRAIIRKRHQISFQRGVTRSFWRENLDNQTGKALIQLQNVVGGIKKSIWREAPEDTAKVDTSQEPLHEVFVIKEHTVDIRTPRGRLSPAAVNAIEQFSRMNGLTGRKMRANFESFAPVAIQHDARNLLEFCCFRYLARGSTEFNPSIKDAAFRRLAFVTMLAWQHPYADDDEALDQENITVSEEAFVRIAPAISGAADRITAHNLFKVLAGDSSGLSFTVWDRYLVELCSVLEGREEYHKQNFLPDECPVCVGASGGQPVQRWDGNIPWPGTLVLTDRALYFQPFGITKNQKISRMDITGNEAKVEKRKVGPFYAGLFDSAISVAASSKVQPWVLEFVDFSGKRRRDFWYLYIQELLNMYKFVNEYAPKPEDPSIQYVYASKNGRRKASSAALLGIARLQAVQTTIEKTPRHPERLLQFCYASNAPGGDLVFQALSVDFWGGRLNYSDSLKEAETGNLLGTDGSIYLRRWMTSSSWKTSESVSFWKQKLAGNGLVLGKNHVVGGQSYLEKAVENLREKTSAIEMTQATLEGAMVAGIPENIDLLKELMFPLQAVVLEFEKLRRWENPVKTVAFLLCFYSALYRNWLQYVLPASLLASTVTILALRGLKASGHISQDFGSISIKEQPPSNTIQKLVSLKEALAQAEEFLQKTNLILLKIRTIVLYRNPKATNMILFSMISMSIIFTVVPFRVNLALLVLDQFSMEMEFRKPMVREFLSRLRAWWESIPATPVTVQTREKTEEGPVQPENPVIKSDILAQTLREWFGDESS